MIIECQDIYKSYGKKRILRGISFEAHGGEIIGISGDNGCGKSTLLSILAGVERPDRGKVRLDGKDIHRLRDLTGMMGYVPQTDPLPPELRVRDCLNLWRGTRADLDRAVADYELGDMLGTRISKLSGGMRRRVSIACAAASAPGTVILDEPTAALDMHYKQLIRDDMRRMSGEGVCVIVVSHDRDELEMCNTCYRMTDGLIQKV